MTKTRPSPSAISDAWAPRRPGARLSSSSRIQDGRRVLDLDNYIPAFLFTLNSGLSRAASRRYLEEFGVGIVEWRTASSLAIEPDISARRVCELSGLDKAAASRSLHLLNELGHAEAAPGGSDPRRKSWRLTDAGRALHDGIIAVALERERILIKGIDPEELETCLKVMRLMRGNIDMLDR